LRLILERIQEIEIETVTGRRRVDELPAGRREATWNQLLLRSVGFV
jgi:hypothetical protein